MKWMNQKGQLIHNTSGIRRQDIQNKTCYRRGEQKSTTQKLSWTPGRCSMNALHHNQNTAQISIKAATAAAKPNALKIPFFMTVRTALHLGPFRKGKNFVESQLKKENTGETPPNTYERNKRTNMYNKRSIMPPAQRGDHHGHHGSRLHLFETPKNNERNKIKILLRSF